MSLFESASVVITPNGIKASKLYAIKPTDGSGDLSVVRATSATRVDANGLIEIPRTNLLRYSEQFDNAAWSKSAGITVTANDGISPDGTMNADRIVFTGVSQFVSQFNSLSAVAHYGSVYVKGTLGETIRFTVCGTEATRTLTGEWQRIELLRATAPSNGNFTISTFSSATARDILIWGAQLEVGNAATEYIPTTSSIRTKFAGIIQDGSSALNIPRLDYSNESCPSILVEPQRTNVLTYSEQFATSWINNGATIISNDTNSPDGTLTADRLTATGGAFGVVKFSTWTATNKVASCFVKANTSNLFRIANVSGGGGSVTFNLSTQAITATTGFTGSIEALPNGWFRCIAIDTLARSGTFSIGVTAIGESVFIWGAQLEAGSYATSYIPTTTASVTRNADIISKTGISDLIGQTEGTMFLDINAQLNNADEQDFTISDGTTNNRAIIRLTSTGVIRGIGVFGGNVEFNIGGTSYTTGSRYKIALGYKNNDVVLYINGTSAAATNTTTISGTLSRLGFDVFTNGGQIIVSPINSAALWKTRLTNDELATLTTI